MNRPFIFLAGEFQVSTPVVFSTLTWSHSMSARPLELNRNGTFCRKGVVEDLIGAIFFASIDSKEIRQQNLNFLKHYRFACWPDPLVLLRLDDRRPVLSQCIQANLVDHDVQFVRYANRNTIRIQAPFVLKTGNLHRGEGKHLIKSLFDLPEWEGLAIVEPFFEGLSTRVLFIGSKHFGLQYDNPSSWIKNAAGADVEPWTILPDVFAHAVRVREEFGLEVCGIDYIVEPAGAFHFLEYNQFPGVGATDEIAECATSFFREKMGLVERQAESGSEPDTTTRQRFLTEQFP